MTKKHIMYIDDERISLGLNGMALNVKFKDIADIKLFSTPYDALDQIINKGIRYDAVISDLHMPKMDGLTFFRELYTRGEAGYHNSLKVLTSHSNNPTWMKEAAAMQVLPVPRGKTPSNLVDKVYDAVISGYNLNNTGLFVRG